MSELLGLIATRDQDLARELVSCEELTKYAVGHRYPDAVDVEPLTQELINEAIKTAEATFDRLAKICEMSS